MNTREIIEWLGQFALPGMSPLGNIGEEDIAWRGGLPSIDNSISLHGISDFPFKFGLINGHFTVSSNLLDSLENCPDEIRGDFQIKNCPISTLEGGPKVVKRFYRIDSLTLASLKGAPTYMGWSTINGGNLTPYECRHLLLTAIDSQAPLSRGTSPFVISGTRSATLSWNSWQMVSEILTSGRVAGIMPSELIPSKIKQLKELSDG